MLISADGVLRGIAAETDALTLSQRGWEGCRSTPPSLQRPRPDRTDELSIGVRQGTDGVDRWDAGDVGEVFHATP